MELAGSSGYGDNEIEVYTSSRDKHEEAPRCRSACRTQIMCRRIKNKHEPPNENIVQLRYLRKQCLVRSETWTGNMKLSYTMHLYNERNVILTL